MDRERRISLIGWIMSTNLHVLSLGIAIGLLLMNWLPTVPVRMPGQQTVISLEAQFLQALPEVAEVTDPLEIAQVEPPPPIQLSEPLKVEVEPDKVQVAQRTFLLKSTEMLDAEVERSTMPATSPQVAVPQPVAGSRPQPKPAERPPAAKPMPRRQSIDLLAAISPPSIPVPQQVGVDEMETARLRPNNPVPIYPSEAQLRGWQGVVEMRFTINTDGTVQKLEIIRSSGYSILDASAYNAGRNWRFEPATRGGQAVEAILRVPVRFRLP